MTDLQKLQQDYEKLESGDRILFLEWLHTIDKWKIDFASMPESLRRFYDARAKREI